MKEVLVAVSIIGVALISTFIVWYTNTSNVAAQEVRRGSVSLYEVDGRSIVAWSLPNNVHCYVSESNAISCVVVGR